MGYHGVTGTFRSGERHGRGGGHAWRPRRERRRTRVGRWRSIEEVMRRCRSGRWPSGVGGMQRRGSHKASMKRGGIPIPSPRGKGGDRERRTIAHCGKGGRGPPSTAEERVERCRGRGGGGCDDRNGKPWHPVRVVTCKGGGGRRRHTRQRSAGRVAAAVRGSGVLGGVGRRRRRRCLS